MNSRIITVHKIDGSTVAYERPSYRDIQRNFIVTEGTQFDKIERGAVSGGVPLVWPQKQQSM